MSSRGTAGGTTDDADEDDDNDDDEDDDDDDDDNDEDEFEHLGNGKHPRPVMIIKSIVIF